MAKAGWHWLQLRQPGIKPLHLLAVGQQNWSLNKHAPLRRHSVLVFIFEHFCPKFEGPNALSSRLITHCPPTSPPTRVISSLFHPSTNDETKQRECCFLYYTQSHLKLVKNKKSKSLKPPSHSSYLVIKVLRSFKKSLSWFFFFLGGGSLLFN